MKKSKRKKPDQDTLDGWLDDPANYKLKYFYFNPKDKRILPEARRRSFRIGAKGEPLIGWTINFANPFSILAAIIILGSIFFLIQLIIYFAG